MTIALSLSGPAMQVWGALMLLAGFLAVFAASRPYEEQWLNDLERLALVVDGATLFMGLALFLNATNRTDARSNALAVVVSLCIVGMNVWFVVRVVRVLRAHSSYRVAAGRCVRRVRARARKRMSSVMGEARSTRFRWRIRTAGTR